MTGEPPLETVTETLVVPNAERGVEAVLPVPNVMVERVRVDVPIE